jgi:hypothetical protein
MKVLIGKPKTKPFLENNFKAYNDLIDGFSNSIKNYPIHTSETFTAYFDRILKMLDEKEENKVLLILVKNYG